MYRSPEYPREERMEREHKEKHVALATRLWNEGLGQKLGMDSFEKFLKRIKTVEIGGKTKDALIAEMELKGYTIDDNARAMMDNEAFTTSSESTELVLFRVTVAELGFKEETATKAIWKRAKSLGFRLCPAAVGPHQRLIDADQPLDGRYGIAMEPIPDSIDYPAVFKVGHGGDGLWLRGYDAKPGDRWSPGHSFVFVISGT